MAKRVARLRVWFDEEGDFLEVTFARRKDHSLVEYALADLPNRLFVSKYQLELPSREQIQQFLDAQIREVSDA